MARAASICAEPGCPSLAVRRGRCAVHAPAPWAGSEQARNERGVLRGATLQRERARRSVRPEAAANYAVAQPWR